MQALGVYVYSVEVVGMSKAIIQPAGSDPEATLEQIKKFKDITVYGFLLNPDPKHPLEKVLKEHWAEIHHLTGEKVMIVATGAPAEYSDALKEYWKAKLGDDFEKTWAEWKKKPDAGAAYEYLDMFEPHLEPSQLPCLVLFTDPDKREALVRPLPSWDADDLFQLLKNIFTVVRDCAEEEDEAERLERLRSLTSKSAAILTHLEHIKDEAVAYIEKNPTKVVTTVISFALALASGNVIALGPAAVTILKAIKDALS